MNQKGISSIQLAELINVSRVTVSNLINNKTAPSVETLYKIADALGVEIWELFTSREDITRNEEKGTIICPVCGARLRLELKKD